MTDPTECIQWCSLVNQHINNINMSKPARQLQ